jgi:probable F420-dependent oxidoreductase
MEAMDVALMAEQLGFAELWIGEMATFDAFALGAAIAVRTEAIHLTIGPLAAAVRDPVALALGVASVASLGGRPAGVAIGASTPVVVERWHGREWDRPVAQLRETVAALRPLLAGEKGPGRFRLRTDPPQSLVTVAAFGAGSVRLAAAMADRMVVNLVTPAQAGVLRDGLAKAAAEAGRPVPGLAAWVVAAVDPTAATLDQLRMALVPYLGAPGYGEMLTAAGFGDLVARARAGTHPRELFDAVPVAIVEAVGAVGDAATVQARLDAFRSAGVDDVAVVPATAGDPAGARTLRALRDTARE